MKTYRAITGRLISRTPIHIGTGSGGDVTDDLCRREAAGDYLIPGTAIGGALRAIATRLAPRLGGKPCKALRADDDGQPCRCAVCHLFGEVNPGEDDREEVGGRASRLIVAHARLLEAASTLIRDGVGIDRASRAAARAGRVKFDLEILPADAKLGFRLELEEASPDDECLLAAALAEWQAGRAWLGGRAARGLGAFDLDQVKLVHRDLASTSGLIAFLNSDRPWEVEDTGAGLEDADWLSEHLNEARLKLRGNTACHEGVARAFITLRFELKVDGLFLANDTTAAVRSGFDHAPLLNVMSRQGCPVLPGASLRGVLRSQAERIARTLTTLENNKNNFLKKCPACNPVEADKTAPLANCDTLLRKQAGVPDEKEVAEELLCLACRLFGSTRRGSRLVVEDAAADGEAVRKVLDFLAIDRFTGGGREGAKFDALALWRPVFNVRLHLDNPAAWELGWLVLAVRDLADGLVPVGFGAAKGFGRAQIEALRADYGFISDDDFAGPALHAGRSPQPTSGLYRVLAWDTHDRTQRDEWRTLGQGWVDAFHQTRKAFKRADDLALTKDSYFDGELPALYDKEAYRWLLEA